MTQTDPNFLLGALFDSVKQLIFPIDPEKEFIFPDLLSGHRELFDQTVRAILKTTPVDLDALFDFIEKPPVFWNTSVFWSIPPDHRETFAFETVRIISPRILGNLKLCTQTLNSLVFRNLPSQHQEMVAIQMAKSVLVRPDNIPALFDFIERDIFNAILFLNRKAFDSEVQVIKTILPRVLALGDLDTCSILIKSFSFSIMSGSDKKMIAIDIIKSILKATLTDLNPLLDLIERDIFTIKPFSDQEAFAYQIIETIWPWMLGDLEPSARMLNYRVFSKLSFQHQEIIAIRAIESIMEQRPEQLGALLDLIDRNVFLLYDKKAFDNKIIETVLSETLGNLELLYSNLIRSSLFRRISDIDKEKFIIRIIKSILEDRPNNLDALFGFIERDVFAIVSLSEQEIIAAQITETVLMKIQGNLELCNNLIKSFLFSIMHNGDKERFVIRIIRDILGDIPNNLSTVLDFIENNVFNTMPFLNQETFAAQITETVLMRIQGNLELCNNLIKSLLFSIMCNRDKEKFVIIIIKSILPRRRSNELNAFLDFIEHDVPIVVPSLDWGVFTDQVKTFLPWILRSDLKLFTRTLHSHFFSSLSFQHKEIIAIQQASCILEESPGDLNAFIDLTERCFTLDLSDEQKGEFAAQAFKIISPVIIVDLDACRNLINSAVFHNLQHLSFPHEREFIIDVIEKSTLKSKTEDPNALLDFIERAISFSSEIQRPQVLRIPSLSSFAYEAIRLFLPMISGNLDVYVDLLQSNVFRNLLSPPDQAEFINVMILSIQKEKSHTLKEFSDFAQYCALPVLSYEYHGEFITKVILQAKPDYLDILFDITRRTVLPNLSPECQEKFIARTILESKHDKLGAILNFIGQSALPLVLPEHRETVVVKAMDVVLSEISMRNSFLPGVTHNKLGAILSFVEQFALPGLSPECKKEFVIRIIENILASRYSDFNALLDFIEHVPSIVPTLDWRVLTHQDLIKHVPRVPTLDWRVFTDQVKTFLPRILSDLKLFTRTLHSHFFSSLSFQHKQIIAIQQASRILEERPDDLKAFIDLTECYFTLDLSDEQKDRFAFQAIEIISPRILGDLDACSSLMNSAIFRNLSHSDSLYKKNFVIRAIKSALESETKNPSAFVEFIKRIPSNDEIREPSFVCRAIKLFLPRISGNLRVCSNLLQPDVFRDLLTPYTAKEIIIDIMNLSFQKEKSCTLVELLDFAEHFALPVLSPEYHGELITEIILQVRPADLDIIFDFTKRTVLLNLSPECREKFITRTILKSTHSKLGAILNFVGLSALPLVSPEHQGAFMAKIFLQVELDYLSILFDFTKRLVFPHLSFECQEKFITEIVSRSIDRLDAILNFVGQSALPLVLPEHRETVVVKAMDVVLLRISECFYECAHYIRYDYGAQFSSCIHFMEHSTQFLSQAQQENYAEQIFNIISKETLCNLDILFSFAKSTIFNWLTAGHKEIFAIQMAEEIKLDDLNKCVRLVESTHFKSLPYKEKVQILIQISNHHDRSFFDFSKIYDLYILQAPIANLSSLKTMKICEVARELTSNPSPDTPETRVLSQTLLESYRSVFDNYDLTLTQFQQERFMCEPLLVPLSSNLEIFTLSSRIKDFEQKKKRESRGKSKTSELI
jgi:hypothetical protein